jgi:hypothetical protein
MEESLQKCYDLHNQQEQPCHYCNCYYSTTIHKEQKTSSKQAKNWMHATSFDIHSNTVI